jgi:hypothetical protein
MYKEKPKCGKDMLGSDIESYPLDVSLLDNIKE